MQSRRRSGGPAKRKSISAVTPKKGRTGNKSYHSNPNLFLKQRNPSYEEYWDKSDVQKGLKRGTLFQGSLTISYQNYEYAFVSNPTGGPDFSIEGMLNRNRALQDDIVVVKVIEEETTSESASTSMPSPTPVPLDELTALSISDQVPLTGTAQSQPPNPAAGSDHRSGKTLLIDQLYRESGMETEVVDKGRNVKAKVVYITEKVHSRNAVGVIKAYDNSLGKALLSPRDYRVPRVIVSISELPSDWPNNIKKYEATNFVCHIEEWPVLAVFPFGKLVRSLGEAGMVEGETEELLIRYDIDNRNFSKEVEDCLPSLDLPWTIPKEEEKKRRDFRNECVFTIDPENARDLDDALHVKKLSNDVYEVGVHIADVSYFVKPGTALDQEASKRATSTYLVQKVIPMLPRQLCEHLCSLNPNEDKLSFSVVWKLSSGGELISQWIGQSIMKSCCKLSYGHAQKMIDGVWLNEVFPPVTGGFSLDKLAESVIILNKLANTLRKQRQSKGTLHLNQPKVHYTLSEATGYPQGCEVYPIRPSNRMIEEFMLMANMTVARYILEKFPVGAMLRRHPPPRNGVLEEVAMNCAKLGVPIDISNADTIQKSLDQYKGQESQLEKIDLEKMVLVLMLVKAMELAVYFSGGLRKNTSPHHYALNVPLYTHFTSPIRRYADIIVHRQLAHALGEGPEFTMTPEEVQEQAVRCNKQKKAAKIVGDMSIELFFSIMLKESGPQAFKAIVYDIQAKSFMVILKEFGLVRRVYFDQLGLKSYEYISGEGESPKLNLVWPENMSEDGKTAIEQTITIFSEIDVMLSVNPKDMYQNKAFITPLSMQ